MEEDEGRRIEVEKSIQKIVLKNELRIEEILKKEKEIGEKDIIEIEIEEKEVRKKKKERRKKEKNERIVVRGFKKKE